MKAPYILAIALVGLPTLGVSQNLIDGGAFFSPAFSVREAPVTSGVLNVTATNVPTTSNNGGSGPWTHGAGGLIQSRLELTGATLGLSPLLGLNTTEIVRVDAQLFSETATTGSSLVFRRDIAADTDVLIGSAIFDTLGITLNGLANDAVDNLVAANALYNWSATRSAAATIEANQTYRVSFNVVAAPGLDLDLLNSITFGITNPNVDGAEGESSTLVDVLGVLQLGNGGPANPFTFDFVSTSGESALNFNFAAQSVLGADLLGGTGALDYLTFSNMSVVAVPEPGVTAMAGVFALGLIARRRRR